MLIRALTARCIYVRVNVGIQTIEHCILDTNAGKQQL